MAKIPCAIIGSGNIGTDLMIKVMRKSQHLERGAMVGIDPASDGLARAARLSVPTTHEGVEGLRRLPNYADVGVVFDATSAGAHIRTNEILQRDGKKVIDLTPAAIGPFTIPVINGDANLDEPNVNMVTCGGQATIPIVHAVRRATNRVIWGEIVASISSKSAGAAVRQVSIADMTFNWPRLTWPALALRHAAPWARKMSATSRRGRATKARRQAGGGRLARLTPSRSNGLVTSRIVLTATRV
jgi:acetaldehyde dehydrogenase (acetylating)